MKIKIIHKGPRNLMICTRRDGTIEKADLGPQLPYHDISHFIVETHLKLKHGFYGNIAYGYTVEQLSSKEIIQHLPTESMVAEIVTRALTSLWSGSCVKEQMILLIKEEFSLFKIDYPIQVTEDEIIRMLNDYEHMIRNRSLEFL